LLHLYRDVFGRERTEAELSWKLLRPGFGVDTLWVADAGERIVGQHAGIPMRIKLGDRITTAVHAVEAMTHSDFRREGMLTLLGGGLYDYWGECGIPLIIGLPHAGWGTRAHALGYRPAFPMRWLSRPLRPLSLLMSKVRPQTRDQGSGIRDQNHHVSPFTFHGIDVRPAHQAWSDFDRLWQLVMPTYTNIAMRDAEWVGWRYFDPPGSPYTVLLATRDDTPTGYIAYRAVDLGGRLIGRIADLFARPNDTQTVRALLHVALAHLRDNGADSAVILVAVGSPLYATVRRYGFLLNRGEYQASFIRLSEEVDAQSLNNPRNWLLTGGDFDVV
jgi:hypothetical protein